MSCLSSLGQSVHLLRTLPCLEIKGDDACPGGARVWLCISYPEQGRPVAKGAQAVLTLLNSTLGAIHRFAHAGHVGPPGRILGR